MEVERNVIFSKSGGNASKNSVNYKINIPVDIIRELGITKDDRTVILKCDNGVVTMSKKVSPGE